MELFHSMHNTSSLLRSSQYTQAYYNNNQKDIATHKMNTESVLHYRAVISFCHLSSHGAFNILHLHIVLFHSMHNTSSLLRSSQNQELTALCFIRKVTDSTSYLVNTVRNCCC